MDSNNDNYDNYECPDPIRTTLGKIRWVKDKDEKQGISMNKWWMTQYNTIVNLNNFLSVGIKEDSGNDVHSIIAKYCNPREEYIILAIFKNKEEAQEYLIKLYKFLAAP